MAEHSKRSASCYPCHVHRGRSLKASIMACLLSLCYFSVPFGHGAGFPMPMGWDFQCPWAGLPVPTGWAFQCLWVGLPMSVSRASYGALDMCVKGASSC